MPCIDETVISRTGTNWVAFSGGPDSVCLLHLLLTEGHRKRLRVVHIDHGLDAESGDRARRAVEIAAGIGIDCMLERLTAEQLPGKGGPEASARHARYSRFQSMMQVGDHLLTAHHADDQVETVLLRLMRGAGPAGLAGMQAIRRLAPGWLARPLLTWSQSEIFDYLERHRVDFLEDPTNKDLSLDRNYLRHHVLPEIGRRWPGYRSSVLQSARWQGAAARALDEEARVNLKRITSSKGRSGETTLELKGWLGLECSQALAVIRFWCTQESISAPPTRPLQEFFSQCNTAGSDRQPAIDWRDACLRAWRGRLWLDCNPKLSKSWRHEWPPGDHCEVPAGGNLVWSGPPREQLGKFWQLAAAPKGARLQLHKNGPARSVNELMREAGIPPWRRHEIPTLSIDDRLCAAGTDWMDSEFADQLKLSGSRLEWQQRPTTLIP